MKRMSGLLCCWLTLSAMSLAVAAQTTAPTAPAAQESDDALPLPETPISVPTLSPQASKADLVNAYYDVTGGRMFEVLMAQFVKPPANVEARVAGCPAAKQLMDAHYRDRVQPHFRGWLDNSVRPRITQVLSEAFGETELRAFLRFAQTPNGQRHLNQIANQAGKGDVSRFPEFLQDAELRAYEVQFDALGERVDDVLGDAQAELMTPQFMAQGRESGERIADLVKACKTEPQS